VTSLLDSNVLVAVSQPGHVHHASAKRWLRGRDEPFATCPVTQGALLRLLLRGGASVFDARTSLESVVHHTRHEFWPDELDYLAVRLDGVVGHRQVTDAYLAGLARGRSASLATFDRGLVALHRDVALLLEP
jgi:toxin-antitoxin system PIN domain toxin